jgi:hypothetical protein
VEQHAREFYEGHQMLAKAGSLVDETAIEEVPRTRYGTSKIDLRTGIQLRSGSTGREDDGGTVVAVSSPGDAPGRTREVIRLQCHYCVDISPNRRDESNKLFECTFAQM